MRPNRDEWAMEMAKLTAQRSTCYRRRVGCVLVNERGHVLATGYNGVASGLPHCNERDYGIAYGLAADDASMDEIERLSLPNACSGAFAASGTNLDGCEAIHAEQNALLQCENVYEIHTCYVTASPCITCVKLLLNTTCQRVVFLEPYPHNQAGDLWKRAGRSWEQLIDPFNDDIPF